MQDNIQVTTSDSPESSLKEIGEKEVDQSESVDEESTDETADDSESSEEETLDEEPKEKPKKKQGGFQRRINKLNSRLSAKEEEAEYWRQEFLKSKSSKDEQTPAKNNVKAEGRPKADDFESHEDYIDALTDWKMEQKISSLEEKHQKERMQRAFQEKTQTHAQRVKDFSKKHSDFNEVLEEVDDVRVPGAIQELIIDSENGPEIMYELAKNRDELERICSLSPLSAAKAIGRIESRLSVSDDKKQNIITKKKVVHPPTPIRSRSEKTTQKSIYDSDLSQSEYEALRRKQLSKK